MLKSNTSINDFMMMIPQCLKIKLHNAELKIKPFLFSNVVQNKVPIWGSMRCYNASDKMLVLGFKDHPVVVGVYSTWLVSNSGRKEAAALGTQIAGINKNVTLVSDDLNTLKKEVSDIRASVKSVKSTADSALSKVRSLKHK